LLVEFHQHTTGLHVPDRTARRPNTIGSVDIARAAPAKPPTSITGTIATRISVVVAVWSTKPSSVGPEIRVMHSHQSVAGVSAVPGHRQSVLTNLITDGERRVFSRVPQTRSTLDLLADTRVLLAILD